MKKVDKARKQDAFETLIKVAAQAYLNGEHKNALRMYNDALNRANELKIKKIDISLIKYMICCCLIKSNKLDDLSEAVTILQTLENFIKTKFPAVYYLLAKAHCKLYRFDQALGVINQGEAILNKNLSSESFYIPGTSIDISQNKNDDDWIKVKKECLTCHVPDAVCKLSECRNVTKPYVTPNINIYIKDPAFNGMVIINCNNKKQPCVFNYHKYCWKCKKNEIYPSDKVTDKEIIGNDCFTHNCMSNNVRSKISFIEVLGKTGEIKAQFKESTSMMSYSNNTCVSKGAVKKQMNRKNYDEQQILIVKEELLEDDFSDECSELIAEKNFLLSFFYHYIENNKVNICDVYSKFAEIQHDLMLTDLDIVTFLLESNKIEILNNNPMFVSAQCEKSMLNHENSTCTQMCSNESIEEIDDVYNELVNNDAVVHRRIESIDNATNTHSCPDSVINKNSLENYNFNKEANAFNRYYNCEITKDEERKPLKITRANVDVFKEIAKENTRLEACVNELEHKLEEMKQENCILKQKLNDKNSVIESLRKEQVDYLKKIEICESLCETMTDFQKRYENVKDDNINLKQEVITIMEEKKNLEEKLYNSDNSELRRHEVLKTFQDEYKILEKCINSDWEEKINKLEQSFQSEIETKMELLITCLNCQYSKNTCILNRYFDQCSMLIKIINSVNNWTESIINIKLFTDFEWKKRHAFIQELINDQQLQYSRLLETLHSDSTEKFKMTNIKINLPAIPNPLGPEIENMIQNTLITLSVIHFSFTTYIHQSGIYFNKDAFIQNIHRMLKMALFKSHQLTLNSVLCDPNQYQPLSETEVVQPSIIPEGSMQQTNQQFPSQDSESSKQKEYVLVDSKEECTKDIVVTYEDNCDTKIVPLENISETSTLNVEKDLPNNIFAENKTQNLNKHEVIDYVAHEIDNKKEAHNNAIQLKSIHNDHSSIKEENSRSKKKIGMVTLLKVLLSNYPGSLEADMIEIIYDIRKKYNNSLTGISLRQILKESETLFLSMQKFHILYDENYSETSTKVSESNQQNVQEIASSVSRPKRDTVQRKSVSSLPFESKLKNKQSESISLASSSCSLNQIQMQLPSKKAWDIIPPTTVKWSPSDESECSVCMNQLKKINSYILSCGHFFHTQCIKKWMKTDSSCPNCRSAVTNIDEFPPLGI